MVDARREMERMLGQVLAEHPTWKHSEGRVEIPTEHGDRQQGIDIELDDAHWLFRSVVLGTEAVTRKAKVWRELAVRAWLRNDATNLVTFTFDAEDQLIGLIRHPADHLDAEELDLYLLVLAAECDRFEYVLGGVDAS